MAEVHFTNALRRFFPTIQSGQNVHGETVKEVIDKLESFYPGLRGYLTEENGALRKHVNIFCNGKLVQDRCELSDLVDAKTEIYIIQALSGG